MSDVSPFTEIAFAKINLALHVRGRQQDGYHALETLFAFAEDGDRLGATPADTLSLSLTGPFAAALESEKPGDNLVLRAAGALRTAFGVEAGAALWLDKRLPVASGIGGGSADAAAALRLLARLWSLPTEDPRIGKIAAALGSDVPACLASVTARGEARGDVLSPVPAPDLSGLPLLLVNPGVGLSTAAVFRAWDGRDRGALGAGEPLRAALAGRNDLEPAACTLVPSIAAVMDLLRASPRLRLARMSGSGATCFAIFEDEADRDRTASRIAIEQPGWWQLRSRVR